MVPKNEYLRKTQLHAGCQSQRIFIVVILVIVVKFIVQAIITAWTLHFTAAFANASIAAAAFADQ